MRHIGLVGISYLMIMLKILICTYQREQIRRIWNVISTYDPLFVADLCVEFKKVWF